MKKYLHSNEIIAFGRRHYGSERIIKKITLNENFDIIEDNNNITFRGEDPRCFKYNDKIYILDNYLYDMYLIDYENNKYSKINISGKNISFINHNNILYFIHYIKPFELYTFDVENGNIIIIYNNKSLKFLFILTRYFLTSNMVETSKTKYVPSTERKYNSASIAIHSM